MSKRPLPGGQTQTIVRMPVDLHAAAVERAKAEERSLAQLIRYACKRYLAATDDPLSTDRRRDVVR